MPFVKKTLNKNKLLDFLSVRCYNCGHEKYYNRNTSKNIHHH